MNSELRPGPARRPRQRLLYTWLLPLAFAACSFASSRAPGDEYMLWGVSSMAGIWILKALEDQGTFARLVLMVLAAGTATMAVAGLLLDWLRASWRVWIALWLVVATAVAVTSLAEHPTLAEAASKHGSIAAYVLFGLNYGLAVATGMMLVVALVVRVVGAARRPKPGCCRRCGYDLRGNVSGRCPECGQALAGSEPARPPGNARTIRQMNETRHEQARDDG